MATARSLFFLAPFGHAAYQETIATRQLITDPADLF
jgi:hypothetical protein